MTNSKEILQLTNIGKSYPGVKALDNVDFTLRSGEVHALLGENGAGKSTLVKVMTGVVSKDCGAIRFMGQEIAPSNTAHAQALGISTVYQEVNLLPNLSVGQNIYLGREPKRWGFIDWEKIYRQSRQLLQRFALDIDVSKPLASYSVAVQQLVAIARGVDMSAQVLILDEPTASLDTQEVERLFAILRELKEQGIGIVFIPHFLDQVYAVSDRITVLRNGGLVGEFISAELSRSQLVEAMLGKELQQLSQRQVSERRQSVADDEASPTIDEGAPTIDKESSTIDKESSTIDKKSPNIGAKQAPLLSLAAVSVPGSISEVSLDVANGEAVGLAGLLGSGRTEVCRAIFGIDKKHRGDMLFNGSARTFAQPANAIAAGMGLCPEDRKANGIIGPLSIRENIILALQARRGWWRYLSKVEQQRIADDYIAQLQIATPDADKPIEQLSGGNQQKVILARWLATQPALLILDEPTRGVDIGAHAEIIRLIKQLCQSGMSLLVTSSELEELVAFADRVVVMRDRRKVAELTASAISQESIMKAIAEA
jgi:galactofuranose transport system ATP-binding protein